MIYQSQCRAQGTLSSATCDQSFCFYNEGHWGDWRGNLPPCNPQICITYSWLATDWGECSRTCGGGVQHRNVTCYSSLGDIVEDQLCTTAKPSDQQSCATNSCEDIPIVVLEPLPGFIYAVNEEMSISWLGGKDDAQVEIMLFDGENLVASVANVSSVSSPYIWTILSDVPSSSNFVIHVISSTNSTNFGVSHPFIIRNLISYDINVHTMNEDESDTADSLEITLIGSFGVSAPVSLEGPFPKGSTNSFVRTITDIGILSRIEVSFVTNSVLYFHYRLKRLELIIGKVILSRSKLSQNNLPLVSNKF